MPHDYLILKDHGAVSIVKKTENENVRDVIVDPNVRKVAVVRKVVVGLVAVPLGREAVPGFPFTPPGYFVLHTATGEIIAGFTEEQWLEQMSALGLGRPALRDP